MMMKNLLILVTCLVAALAIMTDVCAEDYKIGKGDSLEVSVWGVPEMSRGVFVRPDGKITLPAVGDIVANGETPEKLSQKIAVRMREFIKQPIVTVSVQQIQNNRVYITGGVSRVFDMSKETTLLRLLSELGDLSSVDLRRASLLRDGKTIVTDAYALYFEGDMSQDVLMKAEDILFIPSNQLNLVYVLGAVAVPQQLQFYEGMKVLDAILIAGGFTEFAKENTVVVIHRDKSRQKVDLKQVAKGKDISANIVLQPGDYVVVEESLF
jgi:polysaccharide export outer membrane protein